MCSLVSTRITIIVLSSCAKSDPEITIFARNTLITNDSCSSSGINTIITSCVEPFFIIINLQGAVETKKRGAAIFPIGDQRVESRLTCESEQS